MTYIGDYCRFSEYGEYGITNAIEKILPSLASTIVQYGMPSEMRFFYNTDKGPEWEGIPFAERFETVAWRVGYSNIEYNAETDTTVYWNDGLAPAMGKRVQFKKFGESVQDACKERRSKGRGACIRGNEPEREMGERMTYEEYQKLEQEGRLIVLPCAIGDKVYTIDGRAPSYRVKENTCELFVIEENRQQLTLADAGYYESYEGPVTFFSVGGHYRTREEAEQAVNKLPKEAPGKTNYVSKYFDSMLFDGIKDNMFAPSNPLPESSGKLVEWKRFEAPKE